MRICYYVVIAALLIFLAAALFRVIKGPSVYHRMNGLSVMGADVVILLLVYGFVDGRPEMYVDIAIAYGILGFVTNIIVAKYLGGDQNVR